MTRFPTLLFRRRSGAALHSARTAAALRLTLARYNAPTLGSLEYRGGMPDDIGSSVSKAVGIGWARWHTLVVRSDEVDTALGRILAKLADANSGSETLTLMSQGAMLMAINVDAGASATSQTILEEPAENCRGDTHIPE